SSQALFAHEARDALLADAHALRAQLAMNARAAVDTSALLVRDGDLGRAPRGLGDTRRRSAVLTMRVAARRDAEHPAHCADGEGHLLRGDESELHSLSF